MPIAAVIAPLLLLAAGQDQQTVVVRAYPWAPFISPMGEPFHARPEGEAPIARWFGQADRNRDGALTADEMRQDADRFFAKLDADHNGEIDPTEMMQYESDIAPEIQVTENWRRPRGQTSAPAPKRPRDDDDAPKRPKRDQYDGYRTDGLQGAARYGLLNLPQPVAGADADFNRSVTLGEFEQAAAARFRLLDTAGSGRIALAQLEGRLPIRPVGKPAKQPKDSTDTRIGLPLPPKN